MASPSRKYLAAGDPGLAIANAAKRSHVSPQDGDVGFSVADDDEAHANPVAQASFTSASAVGLSTVASAASVTGAPAAGNHSGDASQGLVRAGPGVGGLPDALPRNKLAPLGDVRGSHRSVTRVAPLGSRSGLTPAAKLPRKAFETAGGTNGTGAGVADAGEGDAAAPSAAPQPRSGAASSLASMPSLARGGFARAANQAQDNADGSKHESVYRTAMSRLHKRSSRSAPTGEGSGRLSRAVSFDGTALAPPPSSSSRARSLSLLSPCSSWALCGGVELA